MSALLISLVVVVLVLLVLVTASVRHVQQYERGVVLRFGRLLPDIRQPGLRLLVPFADRMAKLSVQTVVLDVPSQSTITRDNVTIGVDAVVYFRVHDPVRAVINVQNYLQATSQVAQTSLRSVIGRADLDTLLSDRDRINGELKDVIDAPTEEWGISIDRVEIKDISLPEGMRRSMSRQAEAELRRPAHQEQAEPAGGGHRGRHRHGRVRAPRRSREEVMVRALDRRARRHQADRGPAEGAAAAGRASRSGPSRRRRSTPASWPWVEERDGRRRCSRPCRRRASSSPTRR